MINNKQINVWRGTSEPPTIYHVWIYENQKILLHNGIEWLVFIDNSLLVADLETLLQSVSDLQSKVESIDTYTINTKPIKDNPILTGKDITSESSGTFISSVNSIANNLKTLDTLLTTQVIS